MVAVLNQKEHRAVLSPGSPRRTSFNRGPEEIRRWSNPDPHILWEQGRGLGQRAQPLQEGNGGAGGSPTRNSKRNHSKTRGLPFAPYLDPLTLSAGTTIQPSSLGEEVRPYVL